MELSLQLGDSWLLHLAMLDATCFLRTPIQTNLIRFRDAHINACLASRPDGSTTSLHLNLLHASPEEWNRNIWRDETVSKWTSSHDLASFQRATNAGEYKRHFLTHWTFLAFVFPGFFSTLYEPIIIICWKLIDMFWWLCFRAVPVLVQSLMQHGSCIHELPDECSHFCM